MGRVTISKTPKGSGYRVKVNGRIVSQHTNRAGAEQSARAHRAARKKKR